MFRNEEKFKSWLDYNLKADVYDFQACLKDLEDQYATSASANYELRDWETKSGHAEVYSYDVVEKFILDGREASEEEVENNDFDYCETEYIF